MDPTTFWLNMWMKPFEAMTQASLAMTGAAVRPFVANDPVRSRALNTQVGGMQTLVDAHTRAASAQVGGAMQTMARAMVPGTAEFAELMRGPRVTNAMPVVMFGNRRIF